MTKKNLTKKQNKHRKTFNLNIFLLILLLSIAGLLIVVKYFDSQKAHNKIVSNNLTLSGPGLYQDTYETGFNDEESFSSKYYFRGKEVNNNIILNNNCFKIINIAQNDAIKIMHFGKSNNNTCIDVKDDNNIIAWDENGSNNFSTSTVLNYLNEWAKKEGIIDSPLVLKKATWHIGALIFNSKSNLTDDIKAERFNEEENQKTTYTGLVGLINASDYMKAAEIPCVTGAYRDEGECQINNYLFFKDKMWTLNKTDGNKEHVWGIENGVMQSKLSSNNQFMANPVIYLKPNLKLKGEGTLLNPYIVINNE